MYKLLYKEPNGDITCKSTDFEKVFSTLHAYESTNLTPDCIKALQGRILTLSTAVLEQRETIDTLQKALDNLTELWESLPSDARVQAIKIRDSKKTRDVTP